MRIDAESALAWLADTMTDLDHEEYTRAKRIEWYRERLCAVGASEMHAVRLGTYPLGPCPRPQDCETWDDVLSTVEHGGMSRFVTTPYGVAWLDTEL